MKNKRAVAMFGQKRLSREGGIEIVVKELCTRMARDGYKITCYNRSGHHVRDSLLILNENNKIEWSYSQNWNQNQILNRGMFKRRVIRKKYAIIGAGAIGSMVSELLVRSGVWKLLIMDGDILSVGNLSRHTLAIKDINHAKATGLKERLESINSHVRVPWYQESVLY